MTPKRRWGTPTDASAAMVVHRLPSSAMRSNDDNHWPANSLMLPRHDLSGLPVLPDYHLLSTFGRESGWQTWPNHNKLQHFTVKVPEVRQYIDLLPYVFVRFILFV